jgi:hypothetical protein
MDNSTDGVTLLSGFVFDLLQEYRGMERICAPLFDLAKGLDPAHPERLCSMSVYNAACDWIEKHLGQASIREAGRAIGARAYAQMVKDGKLGPAPTPVDIMRELKRVADLMIQDPRGRGWTVLEAREGRVTMRRTQTFNCMLQEGLLASLAERAGARTPVVAHEKCTRRDDLYCEYELIWTSRLGRTKPRLGA